MCAGNESTWGGLTKEEGFHSLNPVSVITWLSQMCTKNKWYNHYNFENIVISSPSSLASGSNVLTLVNPLCPLVLNN